MKQITLFQKNGGYIQLPLISALRHYKSVVQKENLSFAEDALKRSIKLYTNNYNPKTHSHCTRVENLNKLAFNDLIQGKFYHIEFCGLHYIFIGENAAYNACRHFIAKTYKQKTQASIQEIMSPFFSISPKCFKKIELFHAKTPVIYLIYRSYVDKKANAKSQLIYDEHLDYLSNMVLDVSITCIEQNKTNNNQSAFSRSNQFNLIEFVQGNFETTITQVVKYFKDTGDRLTHIKCELIIGENTEDLLSSYFAQELLDHAPDKRKVD